MWKLCTIGILLLLGTILPISDARGQDIAPTGNLSRLLHRYRNASTDAARIDALLQLSSWYLTRAGDDRNILDSATLLANQAAALSHSKGNPKGHEEAGFLLAKAAFKEKDWSRLRRLADACHDSTRIRLALMVINAHHILKDVAPRDNDSVLDFFKYVLLTPMPDPSPLHQIQLLLRLAIHYSSRHDTIGSTAPTLNTVDFTRTGSGPGNWNETLRRWLSIHLHTDPRAIAVLANTAPLDTRDTDAIVAIQRAASRATAYEAGIHWNNGELALAEKEYLVAIDISRRSPQVEAWPYFTIIQFYLSNGNAGQALFYGLEAVDRLRKTGNPDLEFEPWWCLGHVNAQLGKSSLARGYYDTVLSILQKRNQNPDAWLFKSVTQSYLNDNNPRGGLAWLRTHVVRGDMGELPYRQLVNQCFGDCYFALGDYARALPLYLDCYDLGSRINRYNQSLAAFPLGKLYIRTKQYDKARAYLRPLLQPADYYMVPLYIQRDAHLLLYLADSATGNYRSAMKHLRIRQALNDSIFDITRNSQIRELTFRYETQRKDRDLRLQKEHIQLLQNQAQLQRATLTQVRTFRNTLIWGTLMLLLLFTVLCNRYLIKQKSNRLMRSQQIALNNSNRQLQHLNTRQQKLLAEREWLINEVHHRVKTNLQIVTSLLNMQVGYLNDELTLHALGEIGSRIRTLSLIHQRLYREDGDMTTINMRDYIHELTTHLLDVYDKPGVVINRHIDSIELNIGQCVPVGLILNEAITNALLFAFPATNDPAFPATNAAPSAPAIDTAPTAPATNDPASTTSSATATNDPASTASSATATNTAAPRSASASKTPATQTSANPSATAAAAPATNDPAPTANTPTATTAASRSTTAPASPPPPRQSAAPQDPEFIIDITLQQSPEGRITLLIADNGIGLPPDFDPTRDAAMGLQLIKTLGLQLDGETSIENRQLPTAATGWLDGDHHGLRILVTFQRQESDLTAI